MYIGKSLDNGYKQRRETLYLYVCERHPNWTEQQKWRYINRELGVILNPNLNDKFSKAELRLVKFMSVVFALTTAVYLYVY